MQAEYIEKMNMLASVIDQLFNGTKTGNDRETGFVLLVAPFGDTEGRVNYISNGQREDMTKMMSELLARFEANPPADKGS